jgi:hypothetical protein
MDCTEHDLDKFVAGIGNIQSISITAYLNYLAHVNPNDADLGFKVRELVTDLSEVQAKIRRDPSTNNR